MIRTFVILILIVSSFFACQKNGSNDWKEKAGNPEYLHSSLKQITDVIVHDIFSPPVASRIYAYSCIAGYEALIHMDSSYKSLAGQVHGLESLPKPEPGVEYCYPLASVQAVLAVGRNLVFSEDKMDLFYNNVMDEFKNSGMPDDVYERSLEYGNTIAEHIMAWASKDNYKQTRSFPKYSIESDDYTWKPTPPAYMDAVEPHWNKIRTLAMDSASQFKPASATSFSKDKNSQFYREAEEVYKMGKSLTPEQKDIAFFWDCNPFMMNVKGHVMFATKKISPGGHWINITRVACKKVNADFIKSAEAYALVSISLNEGFISCWDEKYRSKLIRPETYINQYIDEDWVPLLQTPPFPEYSSGHSVISSASAVALTKLFGDNFEFLDSTEIEFGLSARKFESFQKAAEEAAISRMYGGIHCKPACMNGITQGRTIGEFVMGKIRTRKEDLYASK